VPIIHGKLLVNISNRFVEGGMRGRPWVQTVSTQALEQQFSRAEVLNKERVGMKFNKYTIVTSKFINGYKISLFEEHEVKMKDESYEWKKVKWQCQCIVCANLGHFPH
jgi:hypothetical protein